MLQTALSFCTLVALRSEDSTHISITLVEYIMILLVAVYFVQLVVQLGWMWIVAQRRKQQLIHTMMESEMQQVVSSGGDSNSSSSDSSGGDSSEADTVSNNDGETVGVLTTPFLGRGDDEKIHNNPLAE